MVIYLDAGFKCHVTNDGTMREVESSFFDGKCARYIEGYRYIPAGETWTRPDGVVFHGEMISPWVKYELLEEYQTAYEEATAETSEKIAMYETALTTMGVNINDSN